MGVVACQALCSDWQLEKSIVLIGDIHVPNVAVSISHQCWAKAGRTRQLVKPDWGTPFDFQLVAFPPAHDRSGLLQHFAESAALGAYSENAHLINVPADGLLDRALFVESLGCRRLSDRQH